MTELEARVRELEGESALAGRREAELEEQRANNVRLAGARGELEEELAALQRRSAEERETLLQQKELARYRALEEERRKWEAREEVLNNNLARVSRELEAVKTTPREPAGSAEVTEQLATVEAQLWGKCEELSCLQRQVGEVEEERDSLKAETEDQRG